MAAFQPSQWPLPSLSPRPSLRLRTSLQGPSTPRTWTTMPSGPYIMRVTSKEWHAHLGQIEEERLAYQHDEPEADDDDEEYIGPPSRCEAVHRDGGICGAGQVVSFNHRWGWCQHHADLRVKLQQQINASKPRINVSVANENWLSLRGFSSGAEAIEETNFYNSVIARRYLVAVLFFPDPEVGGMDYDHKQYVWGLADDRDCLVNILREYRKKDESFDLSAYKSLES
ncbi:hypothetical protein QBC40DRAFT_351332 [Triangularia verruculosa]|uniref:Uncharacterized protein n=1 Tax=Triangularia verruculosa TaxID=2587418 RepID=A0AAN6XAM7_9PEZI|nr:hypothetical protein QBC40DRAFT_351332 [Triangularia verruculosa]